MSLEARASPHEELLVPVLLAVADCAPSATGSMARAAREAHHYVESCPRNSDLKGTQDAAPCGLVTHGGLQTATSAFLNP